jgi:DNA-binding response OmpR family regulator
MVGVFMTDTQPDPFPRIAIIEDNLALAMLYEIHLKTIGVVKVAHDGQAGLALLEAFRPDLVVLDLRLPVMSGDEMLTRLRETEWGANMRVIILTNISKDEAPAHLRLLNVDRYIVKANHAPLQVIDIAKEVLGI